MDGKMLGLTCFILVSMIALIISHSILVKKKKSLMVWRCICVAPLVVCVIHFACCHFRGGWAYTLALYGSMYFAAVLMALWQFLGGRKYGYRIWTVFMSLCMGMGLLIVVSVGGMFSSVNNFSRLGYSEAFQAVVDTMQDKYVLSGWKEIDYEALASDILPMVEQAEQEQDEVAYDIALMRYCYRFHDSHVQYSFNDMQCEEEVRNRLAGNDYGFAMFTLDNGKTVAVLTEEDSEAYRVGIHDGTVVTAWNGVSVSEAEKEIECIYPDISSFPVAENEEAIKSIFLAGVGEEKQSITFIADDGTEQTADIASRGSYRKRLERAIACFYHKDIPDGNFSTKMLSGDCGYLRIYSEAFTIFDPGVSITGDLTGLSLMLEEDIAAMEAEGMTKLIIDLRNNTGGMDAAGSMVASLFADQEYFSYASGVYRDRNFQRGNVHMVSANGRFSEIEVVVLVNADCCSAGDGMAEDLSKLPNVTLMGITASSGVDQEVGGWCIMPESRFAICYPNIPVLDENNEPRIDTRADRITRIPLDEHIPLTEEAVAAIFSENGDYELEYALDYLEQGK